MSVMDLVPAGVEFQQAIGISIGPRLKSKLLTLLSIPLKEFLMRRHACCDAYKDREGHQQ